ncbi:flagellin [Roseovarius atlanticus]|uniref:Flagellin n=1 Tax=Roseovarius atlanticus TaxID=1641875 RepID=A0A0T5NQV8_9RHOB|nr:flagellin [Roseovarius atlanticus]KRS11321.1 flagellin [Roseovarius atlanticus]
MSSILTNNSAMVALQTLRSINSNLASTQAEISTGKSVATAKDNSAVWAISKVMEADVKGFQSISDSLALGESTVAVAQNAAETISDLLTDIKGKIVNAQEANVDRAKIQADIDVLRDQISAVSGAAQFNGLNLLSNRENEAGTGTVEILSSLDRASNGTVGVSYIDVSKNDLGTEVTDYTTGTIIAAGSATTVSGNVAAAAGADLDGAGTAPTETLTIDSVEAGTAIQINISGSANLGSFDDSTRDVSYVARDGDTQEDMANALADAFNARVASSIEAGDIPQGTTIAAAVTVAASGAATITFTGSETTGEDFTLSAIETTDVTLGGGLEDLADIDVRTDEGADAALEDIEGLIQTAIDSAADFGSVRGRIETQAEFVLNLTDSLKSGIGSLVDADMEEASARLQALQVQQQLGVQALSIANSAPQQLLSLFRG